MFTGKHGIGVGKYVTSMDALDQSELAPGLARQARVARGIDFFCAHLLTNRKTR